MLWGLWDFYLVRAEHKTARELGEQLLSLAQNVCSQVCGNKPRKMSDIGSGNHQKGFLFSFPNNLTIPPSDGPENFPKEQEPEIIRAKMGARDR
jgi:hypothetical protein